MEKKNERQVLMVIARAKGWLVPRKIGKRSNWDAGWREWNHTVIPLFGLVGSRTRVRFISNTQKCGLTILKQPFHKLSHPMCYFPFSFLKLSVAPVFAVESCSFASSSLRLSLPMA